MLSIQAESKSDVVLGIFPGNQPSKMDMVELDSSNRVTRIEIKPAETSLHYTWGLAVWTPAFSQFMHDFLIRHRPNMEENKNEASATQEIFLGNVIQAAIENGLKVEAVKISDKPYIDIGTPDNLVKITQLFALKD
jgi:glucose-1-phosphate thymidylyltransferase